MEPGFQRQQQCSSGIRVAGPSANQPVIGTVFHRWPLRCLSIRQRRQASAAQQGASRHDPLLPRPWCGLHWDRPLR